MSRASIALCLAAEDRRWTRALSLNSCCSASAIASELLCGIRTALLGDPTISGIPPAIVATRGYPEAKASDTALGHASPHAEGTTIISALVWTSLVPSVVPRNLVGLAILALLTT